MKTTRTILAILLLALTSPITMQAQEDKKEVQTLFGNMDGCGGYLGLNMKFGEIEGQEALMTGGEVAFAIDRSVNIGVEGYGLVNRLHTVQSDSLASQRYLQMGYGGLHIEPVIASESVVHLTIPILLGAGGVGETIRPYWDEEDGEVTIDFDQEYEKSDFFLIAEPGLNLEVNVFKFMRFTGGASYRFTTKMEMGSIQNRDLNGWQGNVSLRFGWF